MVRYQGFRGRPWGRESVQASASTPGTQGDAGPTGSSDHKERDHVSRGSTGGDWGDTTEAARLQPGANPDPALHVDRVLHDVLRVVQHGAAGHHHVGFRWLADRGARQDPPHFECRPDNPRPHRGWGTHRSLRSPSCLLRADGGDGPSCSRLRPRRLLRTDAHRPPGLELGRCRVRHRHQDGGPVVPAQVHRPGRGLLRRVGQLRIGVRRHDPPLVRHHGDGQLVRAGRQRLALGPGRQRLRHGRLRGALLLHRPGRS